MPRTGDPNPLHALLDRFGGDGDRHVAEIFVERVLTPLGAVAW
jgi:hypothetical protein